MTLLKLICSGLAEYAECLERKAERMVQREEEERRAEEKRRKRKRCTFNEEVSEEQFEYISKRNAYFIRRIVNVQIDGPVVYCVVQSQTKLTKWSFSIDFNDYGCITGRYWINTDNNDSGIPDRLAQMIRNDLNL